MRSQPGFSQWRPHPWHGLPVGPAPPDVVNAYIEITPFDVIKYEVDKITGYLCVDRPQRGSSSPPTLYGFIPRTLCGPRVGALNPAAGDGDGDPMDVCVVCERPIARAEVIVPSRVIGGFRMVDNGEADDKILAVLDSDPVWTHAREGSDLPAVLIERLEHYFATYKLIPGQPAAVSLQGLYGREEAQAILLASMEDYAEAFADARDSPL